MSDNRQDINDHLDDLRHTISVAEANYQIWWLYKSKDTRPKYIDIMNEYLGFFHASIHAHFVSCLLALYRLYETRNDTFNFKGTLKLLSSHLPAETIAKAQADYERARPYWIKVNVVRNKVFGHRCKQTPIDEVFNQAGITANDITALINLSKNLLNDLSHAWSKTTHVFSHDAAESTVRLLDDLNAIMKTTPPHDGDTPDHAGLNE